MLVIPSYQAKSMFGGTRGRLRCVQGSNLVNVLGKYYAAKQVEFDFNFGDLSFEITFCRLYITQARGQRRSTCIGSCVEFQNDRDGENGLKWY